MHETVQIKGMGKWKVSRNYELFFHLSAASWSALSLSALDADPRNLVGSGKKEKGICKYYDLVQYKKPKENLETLLHLESSGSALRGHSLARFLQLCGKRQLVCWKPSCRCGHCRGGRS